MPTRVIAAVALGSNLGDRAAYLGFAHERLAALFDDFRMSSLYETDPVGVPDPQGPFLNAAAVGSTVLSARDILGELLAVERACGRERPFPNAARTIDLDLILYGDWRVHEEGLVVPHPRFRERRFVLEPLAEVGRELRDPVTGLTIGELLGALGERP